MSYVFKIPLPNNYQAQYWLSFNKNRSIKQIETVEDNIYYRQSLLDRDVICKINFCESNCIVALDGINLNKEDEHWIQERICWLIDKDASYFQINSQFQQIKGLKELCKKNLAIPIPKSWGIYESIIRAIISQLVTTKAANTMLNNFFSSTITSNLCNESLKQHFVLSPRHICMDTLKALTCLSKQKQNAIIEITELFLNNAELEDKIFTYQAIKDLLLPIKGIGIWTCASVAIRNTLDKNIFVAKDYSVNKWIEQNNLQITDIIEQVEPYSSYLANYIWFMLEQK